MPVIVRKHRSKMTALASARRHIQQLGPYQSLALMLLPILLVEPLKIVALFVAGSGHWLTGTGMMIAAYAVSFVFVERLFKVVKSKLLTMNWFAHIWTWRTMVTVAPNRTSEVSPEAGTSCALARRALLYLISRAAAAIDARSDEAWQRRVPRALRQERLRSGRCPFP